MNYSDYRLTLDIYDVRSNTVVKVKRRTNTKRLCISFTENGKVYEIADGCTAVFKGKKPDDTKIMNDCDIENNTIYYVMTNNTTSAVGIVDSEVSLYGSDGKVISSPTFSILVEDNPVHEDDEIDSTDELGAFASMSVRLNATEEDVEYLKYNVEENNTLISGLNNRLNNIKVDSTLDETSTNAVQNKAVATAVNELDGRVDTLERNKIIVDNRLDPISPNPVENRVICQALADIGTGGSGTGGNIIIDSELSTTSTNPVQNKVVTAKINEAGAEAYGVRQTLDYDIKPRITAIENSIGDIDTALDAIIAIQEELIGTITFTDGEHTFTALKGMTFGEWVNSPYNTIGAVVNEYGRIYWDDDGSCISNADQTAHAHYTDVIVDGNEYSWL